MRLFISFLTKRLKINFDLSDIQLRTTLLMVNEAVLCLQEGIIEDSSRR